MPLHFVKNPEEFRPMAAHVGHIPVGISSKQQLMHALEAELLLPAHFGQNWDALLDSLRDLSWLPPGRVILVHEQLPSLSPEELSNYLHILEEASRPRSSHSVHSLDVVFSKKNRHHVLAPLADVRPKSPWRRLKAELSRDHGLPYPIQDEFTSQKFDGFEFLMNIIEQRDGSTRQITNALSMAFTMRNWDRARFAKALPSLCIHEAFELRETAVRCLITLLSLSKQTHQELLPCTDTRSCAALLQEALSLGVQENTEELARRHLEQMP